MHLDGTILAKEGVNEVFVGSNKEWFTIWNSKKKHRTLDILCRFEKIFINWLLRECLSKKYSIWILEIKQSILFEVEDKIESCKMFSNWKVFISTAAD